MPSIRQKLIEILEEEELNSLEISKQLSIQEKDVYDHLCHVEYSLKAKGKKLHTLPYKCLSCGYVFKNRKNFRRPGRCPQCKNTHIQMASYQIEDSAK